MSQPESSTETNPETLPAPMDPQPQTQQDPKPLETTFRIWPPSQRTRDAVIKRLVESLSTPSILSKRYGTLPEDEAAATARSIEEDSYSAASAGFSPDDDGIEILQVYSKEISKRMLETVKSRGAAADPAPESAPAPTGSAVGDEVSSGNSQITAETES